MIEDPRIPEQPTPEQPIEEPYESPVEIPGNEGDVDYPGSIPPEEPGDE